VIPLLLLQRLFTISLTKKKLKRNFFIARMMSFFLGFRVSLFFNVEPAAGCRAGPYGKGYPQTDKSFMRARHARPLYYGRLGGGPPAGQVACGRLLPLWIPLPVRAWCDRGGEGLGYTIQNQSSFRQILSQYEFHKKTHHF
jgi:hypothetical protein